MGILNPNTTPYQLIGGESGVRELVDRFYDHMDRLEQARPIRALHARSLKGSREKLFLFLSGWMGGPDLYLQVYGHPMLRRRHLPFSIGAAERDQWMLCMRRALEDMEMPEELRRHLYQAFWQVANHMRNRRESGDSGELPIFTSESPGGGQTP
jgi:hemoglobin